jgi:hypothetical protein
MFTRHRLGHGLPAARQRRVSTQTCHRCISADVGIDRRSAGGVAGTPDICRAAVDINILCHLISVWAREPTIDAHVTVWFLSIIFYLQLWHVRSSTFPAPNISIVDVANCLFINSRCHDSRGRGCTENSENNAFDAAIAI